MTLILFRLKVMMSKADSFYTPRKTEVTQAAIATSSRNNVGIVGGKQQLEDIQHQV